MKLYKKLALAVGLVAGVTGTVYTAGPAGAATPVPKDNKPEVIGVVGSDTNYWVSNNLTAAYNTDLTYNDGDRLVNIPPVVTSPFPTGSVRPFDLNSTCNSNAPNHDVPTYANSNELVYDGTHLPPNGSSAGVSAVNGDGTGCINMARSSRVKGASDPANDQFFAFALDALDWVSFTGSHAPANLSRAQIQQIYTCDPTTGAPFISNWSQVGGSAGTIVKYAPQTQSGTYSFFKSQFLGGLDVDTNCNSSHKSIFLEEHDARGVSSTNKPNAILPFSYAQWNSDSKGVTPDLRNGVQLKSLDGVAPSASSINESSTGTSGHFDGTRYVNFMLLQGGALYSDGLNFAGVTNTAAGWLCSNKGATIIKLFGFTPLGLKATGGGVTIASYCRLNAAAL